MGKTIEIDEVEYTQNRQLREVIGKLMADPKRAAKLEELRKEVEPNAPTPHLDQLKAATEPVEKVREEFDKLKKELAEEKAKNEQEAKLSALARKIDAGNAKLREEGWTEDGIKTLTEFREKEGILDPIAAAAYYEKLNGAQVAPMQPSSGTGAWNFSDIPKDENDFVKKLMDSHGQNDLIVETEAQKVLKEIRGGGRR